RACLRAQLAAISAVTANSFSSRPVIGSGARGVCRSSRRREIAPSQGTRYGADFSTIWSSILENHPLVTGLSRQSIKAGRITIEVPLITGQRLVCNTQSGEFALD